MNGYARTLKPVLAAMILGACSTTPEMPKNAWKIAPVQTVRHGGPTAEGYFALGRVKEGQGAATQAVEAYRKAISADPAHVAARNALGTLQMRLGRTDEGLHALERAASLAPATSHLHNNLGYALLLVGRDDDAAKALRRAVELDGGNRRAWSNLATAYRRLAAPDQAEFAEAGASGRWPLGGGTATITAPTSPRTPAHASAPAATSESAPARQQSPSPGAAPAPLLAPVPPAMPTVTIGTVAAEQAPVAMPIAALAPAISTASNNAPSDNSATASIETQSAALGFATVSPPSVRTAAAPAVTTTPRAILVKVAENVFELRSTPKATTTAAAAIAEAAAIIAAAAPAETAVARSPVASVVAQPVPPPVSNAADRTVRYEISNGHGGEGLARRLATLLGQQGFTRPRLTNQRPYKQPESVVQYRDGHRATAEAFASQLPFRPMVMATASGDLQVDVRLLLGHDLTTSDACSILGLCPRLARSGPAKLAAIPAGQ